VSSMQISVLFPRQADDRRHIQGLGTSDCKTELCTGHILANSNIDRRAQPQIAVERFAVLDFLRSLANPTLAIGCVKALEINCS
jgi:hypothetical protein